jgi:hypothetical protein
MFRGQSYILLLLLGGIWPLGAPAQNTTRGTVTRESLTEAANSSPVLTTQQRSFFIPVTVDRTQAGLIPVEVQLLVSQNEGKNWTPYARQNNEGKGFTFTTQADGLYWFASRTVDAQGRLKPAGELQPELKIFIDATPPQIEFDAAINATGEVKAAWRITDTTLESNAIKMEYQAGDTLQPAWSDVPLKAEEQKLTGDMLTGAAAWTPHTNSRVIDIRLSARDKAGNIHAELRRVFIPRVAKTVPQIPEWPPRTASSAPKTSAEMNANDPFTARMPTTPVTPANTPEAKPVATPTVTSPAVAAQPWPTNNQLPTQPLAREQAVVAPQVREGVPAQSSSNTGRPLIFPGETPAVTTPPVAQPTVENNVGTAPPYEIVKPETTTVQPELSRVPIQNEAAKNPLLSASKSFALEYDLHAVGPAGVKDVELWVTTDDGTTWQKWGNDDDRRSPFDIQVESERTFGFRMVIISNNGLATRQPEPGNAADVYVTVDSTKPNVQLLQAGYGAGEHAGQLDIRWRAEDEHLGARPISIVFSDNPDGPYTTLAAGLPNTGQYFWTVDPRTPRQLYLRIEVRDEAGNLAIDQTLEPIGLEGLAPRGQIRAVSPTNTSNSRNAFPSPLFR